jgi:anti-anti-sigma regulatory factor/anti-sigma regulatory factor (Ser/Thr protein kinase)
MPARIKCFAELRFPVSVVRVTGTLDLPGATAVRSFLLSCLIDQPVALVVDLSGVAVDDDLALALLPATARRAAEWPGIELLLCASDPELKGVLDRIGVSRLIRVCRDRQEALAVAARQPPARRLRQRLPAGVDAPRRARDLIARAATTWRLPPDPMQVAQVIATELVTNAVRHARTPMDFSVVLRDRLLHVAVCDGDPSPPRRRTIMSERDDHGRGLQLVDGLAATWGCVPMPDGKVVWAAVPAG